MRCQGLTGGVAIEEFIKHNQRQQCSMSSVTCCAGASISQNIPNFPPVPHDIELQSETVHVQVQGYLHAVHLP